MPTGFSTGSQELDDLLEELRAGDNVVFYTPDQQDYLPFVSALLRRAPISENALVYVRSQGTLDAILAGEKGVRTVDVAQLSEAGKALLLPALETEIERIGPRVYYVFEPLTTLAPWVGDEDRLCQFFLTICPLLFRYDTVAYWSLIRGAHSLSTLAAIKECTQIFLQVDRFNSELYITPAKVWGRYSEAMFHPHHVRWEGDALRVVPLPVSSEDQYAYISALAEKNRELAEIRDALNQSNQELKQRNRELAELNLRLSEQSRLYQSLRTNLEHLLAVFQAGQAIGSSLALGQVRQAIVNAATRLLDAPTCRLYLPNGDEEESETVQGMTPEWEDYLQQSEAAELRETVMRLGEARSTTVSTDAGIVLGSLAIAPIVARGINLGTLEVCARDTRLDREETVTLLNYLASEASIALDNARLYREVEMQGKQLRSFVENVITSGEQESRRLAFDLHDGLVQLIVAAYQHLQTAQAWRTRDPGTEEKEIEQGVQLVRRAIYESRRLISQLRPTGLDDFGLVHALRLYVAQLATETDWQVSLDVDPHWTALPPTLEAALFRIVQEATTNARKYANAPRVQIQLRVLQDQFYVAIRDWGRGFNPKEVLALPQQGLHMGLIGIRERAHLWGGRCVIKSQPGKGTSIEVYIPRSRALAEEKPLAPIKDKDDSRSTGG